MSLEEQSNKCSRIHDTLAEFWNWAYYNTPHRDCSWLLAEYVKKLKPDVENRVPIMLGEVEELLSHRDAGSFSLLDVGCGVGGFLHKVFSTLPEKYPKVKLRATGIDISKEMIIYASKNLVDFDNELVCGNIVNSDLKLRNEPFDMAILMVTLSFYNDENAKEILSAIHTKLKEDGSLVVMDFAWSYRWKSFKLFAKPLQKLTDTFFSHLIGESFHFTNRTEDHIQRLLNATGYMVSRSYLSEKKSKMKGMQIIVSKRSEKLDTDVDTGLLMPKAQVLDVDH